MTTPKSFKDLESEVLATFDKEFKVVGGHSPLANWFGGVASERIKEFLSQALRQSLESYEQAVDDKEMTDEEYLDACKMLGQKTENLHAKLFTIAYNASIEKRRENIKKFFEE